MELSSSTSDRARKLHTTTLLPDFRVLIAGGVKDTALSTVRIFPGFTWATGSLSSARSEHTATLLPDGRVLAAGGLSGAGTPLSSSEMYGQAAGAWSVTGSLKTARAGHTATLLPGGRALMAGGYDGAGHLASCELYTAKAVQWAETAPMFTGRMGHTATLLPNGKVLALGGADNYGFSRPESAEIYDPEVDAWRAAALPAPRQNHASTLLPDGRVLVSGGYDESYSVMGVRILNRVDIYDSAADRWISTSPLQTARAGHASVLLPSGKVLVAGGYHGENYNYSGLSSAEIYDPATGMWSATGSMATARKQTGATLLADGRVLVLNGYSENFDGYVPGSAEIYEPRTGAWSAAGSLVFPHVSPSVTLLPNGQVLVAGGVYTNDKSSTGNAEIYDPATNAWRMAAPMKTEGVAHTATLLHSGKVLVAGSYHYSAFSTNRGKAEMYDPATDTWSLAGDCKTAGQNALLMPDGRVLLNGGFIQDLEHSTPKTQTFDPYFASADSPRPVIASAVFDGAARLTLSGAGFTGGIHTAAPVVQLRRLDNGQTVSLLPDPEAGAWTDTSFTSLPLTGFPQGHVMVTVFVNGIPGVSSIVSVPAPEIGVERTGTGAALTDGGAVTFDSTAPGAVSDITFTVKNTGTMDLTGLAVSFSGANAGDFTLTAAPAASVPGPSGSTNFTVRFAPVSPGVKTAVLHLVSSDTDESPFDLTLTGAGSDSAPVIAAIPAQTISEDDATGAIAFTVSDGETPGALTLTGASSNPALIAASGIVFGGAGENRTVTLTPLPNQSGAAVITVTVSDGVFQSSTSFNLTVNPVDDPPALDAIAGPVTVLEDAGLQTIALSGISAGPGESGQALTITAASSNPALIPHPQISYSSPQASGSLTFTPAANAFGSALITVSVSDGPAAGHTVTQSFTVTVTPVNDPPTLAAISGPAPIAEDSGTQTIALSGISAGPGEDGQPLSVTAVSSNPALIPHPQITYSSPQASGTLRFTPVPDGHGTAIISVTVSDSQTQNSTVVQIFTVTVTVTPVNDPPALAAIAAPAPLREGAGVQRVNFSGVSAGAGDTESVTVTAVSSNPALIAHPFVSYSGGASSGFLEFTPAPGMSGAAEITVTADDGQGGAEGGVSRSFTVRVLPLIRGEAASVMEGNEGTSALSFRLFIGSPQTEAVRVSWTAQAGTALAGSDFTAGSGEAVIAAGQTETFAEIGVTGDAVFEADETLILVLSNPSGAFLGDISSFTGTILNDDAQPALTLTPGSVTESSSGGPFRVWVSATLGAPSALPLTWTVQTRAGTAAAGADFTPLGPAALTFAPGETSKWVAVGITGAAPGEAEDDEEFYLDFTPAAGPAGTVEAASALCTVRQLAVRDFLPLGDGVYALRFPSGAGQSYVIEEAPSPNGPWARSSSLLFGSGSTITQVVFSEAPRAFFRVSAAPAAPGAAALGP